MGTSSQTIVVTGASGFVGSALTAFLTEREATVIPVSRRRLPGMHIVSDYAESPDGDVLVHLAGESDRSAFNFDGAGHHAEGTRVISALCSRRRYRRVILASSGMVYGDCGQYPFPTTMPVIGGDAYTTAKISNETIVLESGGVVARLSNLYGPGMRSRTVLTDILAQTSADGPVLVRDDRPVRDFLDVNDAVMALSKLVETAGVPVVNVGSGVGTSIGDLARMVLTIAGQPDRAIMATHPSNCNSVNVLDISATTSLLGWQPRATLSDHLHDLVRSPLRGHR